MGMNIMRMKGRAKMMRTIKVTGKGKIAVKPDKIWLYVNKEGLCQEFVVKMWSNQENRVRKRMLRHAQLGKEFPRCRAVALYSSMKETSFSSKLEGGFSL